MVASRFDILYSYVALDLTVFGFIANSNCKIKWEWTHGILQPVL